MTWLGTVFLGIFVFRIFLLYGSSAADLSLFDLFSLFSSDFREVENMT